MTDFDTIRKVASLPTRVVSLCLAGEILEEIAGLERQLEQAAAPVSLADTTRRDLADQIVAAQARMRESTVDFRLRALPSRTYSALMSRQPEKADGEDEDTFRERFFAWAAEVASLTIVEPAMTVDEVGELADLLNARMFNSLMNNCLELNSGDIDVPNSAAASALIGDSEPT